MSRTMRQPQGAQVLHTFACIQLLSPELTAFPSAAPLTGASSLPAGDSPCTGGMALSDGFTEASGEVATAAAKEPSALLQGSWKKPLQDACKAQPTMEDFRATPGPFLIPGSACSILIVSPSSAAKKPNASQQPIIYPDTVSLCSQEEFKHLLSSCVRHPRSLPRD